MQFSFKQHALLPSAATPKVNYLMIALDVKHIGLIHKPSLTTEIGGNIFRLLSKGQYSIVIIY